METLAVDLESILFPVRVSRRINMFDELETDELVVPDVTYTVDPDDYDAAVSAQ